MFKCPNCGEPIPEDYDEDFEEDRLIPMSPTVPPISREERKIPLKDVYQIMKKNKLNNEFWAEVN